MIGGLVTHDGHPALASHLARMSENESVLLRTHGLSAESIADALAELRSMAWGSRTAKPLIHAWASPSRTYSNIDWEKHRTEFEREFNLEGAPCLEVFHTKFGKGGRTASHVHRVYLRLDVRGKVIPINYSAVRQEKVSRVAEHLAGERLTSGRFNKAVIARLIKEGRHQVADAMVSAGLGDMQANTAPTSAERAMTERLEDLASDEVWRRVARAWASSDTPRAFKSLLLDSGLRLAMGNKCPVAVTAQGAVHPLLRAINRGRKRDGLHMIKKAELNRRVGDILLPPAGEIGRVPSASPQLFAITGLERQPVPNAVRTESDVSVTSGISHQLLPILTPEQQDILLELHETFHSGAAKRAKAAREDVEAVVLAEAKQRDQQLRTRVAEIVKEWNLPTLGRVGWREEFRAQLAGLPPELGPRLRWVEKLDADRKLVILRSGTRVTLTTRHVQTDRQESDALMVMVEHACTCSWQRVTITGGSPEWRVALAVAATRRGLTIVDSDLQMVSKDEDRTELSDAPLWKGKTS